MNAYKVALLIFLLNLTIHCIVIQDYGFTWDFHFHFFAGANFFGIRWNDVESRLLPYGNPDPRNTVKLPYGPIVSIIPYASYHLFHHMLQWLPDDVSYHLPIVIFGSTGPVVLFFFIREMTKSNRTAIFSAVCMSLYPRYFADLHNNMKDIPSSVVFAFNMWMLYRLYRYRSVQSLLLVVFAFAVAFNTKVNAIFIPIIFAAWIVFGWIFRLPKSYFAFRSYIQKTQPLFLWFLFAPAAAFGAWWAFWGDPIAQIQLMFETFGVGTNGIEVLLHGQWFCSGYNVPWYYAPGYLFAVTPIPLLLLSAIGALISLVIIAWKRDMGRTLLFLWLLLPLTRYLLPTTGVIDGIRHFQEVVFPLMIFAAIGADGIANWIDRCTEFFFRKRIRLSFLPIGLLISYLCMIIIMYHPYQISYFNEWIKGPPGAYGLYDIDYWGTSQKNAVQWVNEHAPKHSSVTIAMMQDVGARYLRPDLLAGINTKGYEADYVIVLNRQSFFYRYWLLNYLTTHTPVYQESVLGVPTSWVFTKTTLYETPIPFWWKGEDPCVFKYW